MVPVRISLGVALFLMMATACFGELQYTRSDGYITITGGDTGETHVRIPPTLDGLPVKVIARSAFEKREGIRQLELPAGLERIEYGAFGGCTGLGAVNIPEGVKSIGDFSFNHCLNLTRVTLPDSLLSIGTSAFASTRIQRITIPVSVKHIGHCPFVNCRDLKSIAVAKGNTSYAIYDGILIGKERREVVQCVLSRNSKINIPRGIEIIGGWAFSGCTNLCEVRMPDSVTTIEESAFAFTGIKEVRCSPNLKSIGKNAFVSCTNLEYAFLNDGLEKIGENAFYNCAILKPVRLPASVTDVGLGAIPYNSRQK